MEDDLPAPRGQKKGLMVKYMMGGGMVLGIIGVIWFPLALFAFSNTVGEPNLPYDVAVSLRIGPYEPVYVMSSQSDDIIQFNSIDWDNLNRKYMKDRSAITFLSNYEGIDVAAVKLGSNSSTIWNISPPDRERLLADLKMNKTLTTRFTFKVSRESGSKEISGIAESEHKNDIVGNDTVGLALIKILESTDENHTYSVIMPTMMPKFLKVKNNGDLKPAHQLLRETETDDDDLNYRNLTLRMFESQIGNSSSSLMWWEANELCNESYYKNVKDDWLYSNCKEHITIYMFCDKIFPSTISSIAAGGIVGLYTTLIFVFSRMLRGTIFQGSSSKIMFEDLPYVDRVLQLCLDIYLVRESNEFCLEEDLFAKLIFLYRSPETMIKWTRPKKEKGPEEDDDSDSLSSETKTRKRNKKEHDE
jgi:piezo-type mechanosensitive ion channel component 1/2